MQKFQRLVSALTLAVMLGTGMTLFGTASLKASDGRDVQISAATICRFLDAAEAALAGWPDGRLKSYLVAQIEAAEAANGCQ